MTSATAHGEVSRYEDDNVGVEAAEKSELVVEGTSSNLISRWRQRQTIKSEYAAASAGKSGAQGSVIPSVFGTGNKAKERIPFSDRAAEYVENHAHTLLLVLTACLLILMLSSSISSCSLIFQGSGGTVLGTSYTAKDEDILAVDADYTSMETALRSRVNNMEVLYPGYDEYVYDIDETGHNPFELASYLTVIFEDYTEAEVQEELERLFAAQYDFTVEESIEIRTRVETVKGSRIVLMIDTETGELSREEEEYEYEVEVEYEYSILNITLRNKGLVAVIESLGLTADQLSRYEVLMETYGNKKYLFEDSIYAVTASSEYSDYQIPAEALTDEKICEHDSGG